MDKKYNKIVHKENERLRKLEINSKKNEVNTRTHNLLKIIEGKDPKYAKHILARNDLVMQFAIRVFGGVELLDQPVCPACETPAAWNSNATGHCFRCHRTIPADKVVTVREYLIDQVKGISEEDLEILNMIGGA